MKRGGDGSQACARHDAVGDESRTNHARNWPGKTDEQESEHTNSHTTELPTVAINVSKTATFVLTVPQAH